MNESRRQQGARIWSAVMFHSRGEQVSGSGLPLRLAPHSPLHTPGLQGHFPSVRARGERGPNVLAGPVQTLGRHR